MTRRVLILLVPLMAALFVQAAPSPSEELLAIDEAILKDASVGTDGPALIEYFRTRTLAEPQRIRVARLIDDLGADDYQARENATKELVKVGAAAAPALLQATDNADPEVASRARECLNALGARANSELHGVAARVLAARKPEGAVDALLAYLPCAFDETLEMELVNAIGKVGVTDGKPATILVEAANDKLPLRRLAAAVALARSKGDDNRATARKLLSDTEPRVRLAAATALVMAEDREAVPTLFTLFTDAPPSIVWQAEEFLGRLAADQAPIYTLDPNDRNSRTRARDTWQTWWKTNGDKIDLAKLNAEERSLGLTLISEFDGAEGGQGSVAEFGPDGKARWKVTGLIGPADAVALPGGRILVAEHSANRVTERSRDGKVVWQHAVGGNPVSCQRLANGNTFIATYNEVLEVTRDNKVVFSRNWQASIYCALKLPNGHILLAHSGNKLVEMTTEGKEIKTVEIGNSSQWAGVEPLPNGHFLVALYADNKVVEIGADGKVFLTIAIPQPTYATRLANGHTLATDTQTKKVIEFDRQGKKVKEQAVQGRPFRVRRR
jgi:HEAT repeat protein